MFKSHTTIKNIQYVKSRYNIDYFHSDLDDYIQDLNKRRTKYYLWYYFNNTLRFFQSLSTLGVTILTTTNNPYINDYKEEINIYLWYLAMFTTLVNFILESTSSCYDIKNNKIINDLLRSESIKLKAKKIPYDDITHPNNNNKISCFIKAVNEIRTYNSSQPIVGLSKLYDRSTTAYSETTPFSPRLNNYINEQQRRLSVIDEAIINNDESITNNNEPITNNDEPITNNDEPINDEDIDMDDMPLYKRLLRLL